MALQKKATKVVNVEEGTVTWSFSNESSLVAKLDDFTPEVQRQLALHGLSQKGGDSYAGAESVEDAFKACNGVIKELTAGNWSTRAAGVGPRTTLLAQAIARIAGQPIEAVQAQLEEMEDAQVKEIKKHPKIQQMINTIKGEKLAAASEGAPDLATLFASAGASDDEEEEATA